MPTLIATVPPGGPLSQEILGHPLVGAGRLNTVRSGTFETLSRLKDRAGDKPLYIDLKGKQIRVTKWCDPNLEWVEISHEISVDLPTEALFRDHAATVVAIEGKRLLLERAPLYAIGAGQAINILDPSLKILGGLTEKDRLNVEYAKKLGLHDYMLSFVEEDRDIEELLELDPDARIVAKIESQKGLDFVRNSFLKWKGRVRLMAARDDLFIHLGDEVETISEVEKLILDADPTAIIASRILTSLERKGNQKKDEVQRVSLGDIKDLESILSAGWKNLMLCDTLCSRPDSFHAALAVYSRVVEKFEHKPKRKLWKLPLSLG